MFFLLPIGDINPRERTPYLNYLLLALNIAIFLALGFSADYEQIVDRYGMVPARTTFLTLITSMFLHGDIWHLFGNMLFLWICGDNVEDRYGHIGYLLIYFGCGITAGLAHAHMAMDEMCHIPTIGASGAITGILGAYVVLFPGSRIKFIFFFWIFAFIKVFRFTMASFWAIGFWFAKETLLAAVVPSEGEMGGIAYWAHVGGCTVGIVVTLFLRGTGIVRGGHQRARETEGPPLRESTYGSWR